MECWDPPEDPVVAAALWSAACDAVWALTGRQVGVCTYQSYYGPTPGAGGESCLPSPALYGGRWFNVMASPNDCCRLRLYPGPVVSVAQVKLDGIVTSGWFLAGDWLISTRGCWPADVVCGVPRVHVEWTAGVAPPPVCLYAAAELADELKKACVGDPGCRLPSNVVSVTRQGVTVNMADPTALLDQGLTGLARVDLAIRTLNPSKLASRPRAYSPDAPRQVRG